MTEPRDKTRSRPSLTGIEVAGFKSIKKARRLAIKPLTVLAGANSSGKSSMLQPLLLLKQTIDAPFDPGALRLNGPNLKFTRTEQVLSRPADGSEVAARRFSVSFENAAGEATRFTFACAESGGFVVESWEITAPELSLLIRPDATQEEIAAFAKHLINPHWEPLLWAKPGFVWRLIPDRFSFSLEHQAPPPSEYHTRVPDPFQKQIFNLRNIIHVPGLRGTPERAYNVAAAEGAFEGHFDPYAASVIDLWQRKSDDRLRVLQEDLARMQLTAGVETRALNDTQVELRVGLLPDSAEGGTVNIADVGFGVSQVLPVLVAVLAAGPGQLVLIEQPEIHLHPKAHVALAAILAREAGRGKLLVVETHSAHVLRGVQTAVAEGGLDPDAVALHWFTRDAKTGQTEIHDAELDDAGAFGDWPVDFDDVAMDQDERYLRAALKVPG